MQNKLTTIVRRPLNKVNVFALTASVAVLGLTSVPVQAKIASTDTITTSIDGYLLTSEAGAQRVYAKLSKIAENSCDSGGHQTLLDRRVNRACTVNLLNDFIVDLGDARVTAYHQRATAE
jgi:UrcA family protein